MMKLYQLSERIYYSAYEEERDRPALGYIKGKRFSVAVDAGHSKQHLDEFYEQLEKHDLPLPSLTVITHWHWDHSFAMHAVHGLTIANERTDKYLKDFIQNRSVKHDKEFLKLDPSIEKEYAGNKEIIVVPADIVYSGSMKIDTGDLRIEISEAVSPHTDDASFIYIPEERVLFFGDATSGVFPTWIADKEKTEQICQLIDRIDPVYCIGGHWPIYKKNELLEELRNRD